jgi:hypothetical protein
VLRSLENREGVYKKRFAVRDIRRLLHSLRLHR